MRKAAAATALCVFIGAAASGEEVAPVKLSLGDAVNRALAVDQDYLSAQEDVAAGEAARIEARAGYYPTVTLDVSATQILGLPTLTIPANTFGTGFPPEDVKFSASYDRDLAAGVTAAQPLYMGGRVATGYRMSKLGYRLAEESLRGARADTIDAVVKAYYGAVLAEEAVRVADTSVAVATSHVTATEDRYNAGLVSEYDVLRAKVQLSNLKTAQRRAEDGRAMACRNLLILLNQPQDTPLALTDRLAFEIETFSLEESLAEAENRRPELAQLEYSRLLAEGELNMARANDNPTLMFVASYKDFANDFTLDFADEWHQMGTLSLAFSWPLFDGLATRGKVGQARAKLYKADYGKARLAEVVDMNVRGAYDAVLTAEAQVRSQQENVTLAQRGLEIAEARYEAGLMSNLEVLDAQAALTQAQLGYYQALHDYELATYDMRRARGELADLDF